MKLIRFANEGFQSYKTTLHTKDDNIEVNGCYCFIRKVFKGALHYRYPVYDEKGNLLKSRDKDKKNIMDFPDDTLVYSYPMKLDEIYFTCKGNYCITPDLLLKEKIVSRKIKVAYKSNWCHAKDDVMELITLKELNSRVEKYEQLIKQIKEHGYSVSYSDTQYPFYQVFLPLE